MGKRRIDRKDLASFRENLERISGGMSQEKLAEIIGVTPQTMSKKLTGNGNQINLEDALAFAHHFECTLDDLFGFSNQKFVPKKKKPLTYRDVARMLVEIDEGFGLDIQSECAWEMPTMCLKFDYYTYRIAHRGYKPNYDVVYQELEDTDQRPDPMEMIEFLNLYAKQKKFCDELSRSAQIDKENGFVDIQKRLVKELIENVAEDPAPLIPIDVVYDVPNGLSEEEKERYIEELKRVDDSEINKMGYKRRHPESFLPIAEEKASSSEAAPDPDPEPTPAPEKKTTPKRSKKKAD